jgi:hypothetical protein
MLSSINLCTNGSRQRGKELEAPVSARKIPASQLLKEEAFEAMKAWKNKTDKTPY